MQKFVLLYSFCCVILNLRAVSKYKPPGAYIWRGIKCRVFCVTSMGGLYMEGFYFQDFTVSVVIGQEPVTGNQRNLVIS